MRLTTALPIVLCACAFPSTYDGTGSLRVSGSPSELLALHHVSFEHCSGTGPHPSVDAFTVLAVGDRCLFFQNDGESSMQPAAEHLCTLVFPEGARTLHVTDSSVGHGAAWNAIGEQPEADFSNLRVQIGGDDTTTGQHVVYRFSGSATANPTTNRCTEARRQHGSTGATGPVSP